MTTEENNVFEQIEQRFREEAKREFEGLLDKVERLILNATCASGTNNKDRETLSQIRTILRSYEEISIGRMVSKKTRELLADISKFHALVTATSIKGEPNDD